MLTSSLIVMSIPLVMLVLFLVWATVRALSRNKYIFGTDKFSNLAFQKIVLMRYPNKKTPERYYDMREISRGLQHSAYYKNHDLIRRVAMFVRSSLKRRD